MKLLYLFIISMVLIFFVDNNAFGRTETTPIAKSNINTNQVTAVLNSIEPARFHALIQYVVKHGGRKGELRAGESVPATYFLFEDGPTIEKPGSKYGIIYLVEITGFRDDRTKEFTSILIEFSRMELTYCNFLYKNYEDFRFRRNSISYFPDGTPKTWIEFIHHYSKEDNDGLCLDIDTHSQSSTTEKKILPRDVLWIEHDLSILMKKLGF